MILEEETFEKFGYYSRDLKPKSGKKIFAACDDCGKVRVLHKSGYHAFCRSCVAKKRTGTDSNHWKGGKVKQICTCGNEFSVKPSIIKQGGGKFCSRKCQLKDLNENHPRIKGENHPNWQGGISFGKYCHKFNNEFKEYIRDKFGRVCFLCPTTEEENGRKLDVHHVNYNKDCGCDDDKTCQFVPLCRSCNSKANIDREMWEAKIKAKMRNKLNGWYI